MQEPTSPTRLDRIAASILIAVIGLTPLFFVPFLGIGAELAKAYLIVFGALVVLIAWFIGRIVAGTVSFPKNPVFVAILGLPLAMVLSALFSPAPHVSFGGILLSTGSVAGMAAAVVMFLASVLYLNTEQRVATLGKVLLAVTGIISLFEVVYLTFGSRFLNFGNFFDASSNPIGTLNDMAIWYGVIVIVLMLAYELMTVSRKTRLGMGVLLVVSLFFLAFANFVFIWVLLSIFALLLFVYALTVLRASKEESEHHFPTVPFIVLLIALFFSLANPIAGGLLSSKLGVSQTEVRPSVVSTGTVMWQTLVHHPFVGVGPDRFTNAWLLYRPANVMQTQFWNTQFTAGFGFVPTLVVTTGILGTLAILAFLFLYFMSGFFHAFRTVYEKKTHFYILASFGVSLFLWIVAFGYNPGIVGLVGAFVSSGIFIGVLNTHGRVRSKEINFLKDPRHSFFGILSLVLMLLVTIYFLFVAAEKFTSVALFTRAQDLAAQNNLTGAGTLLNEAVALYPADTYYRAGTSLALSNISQLVNNTSLSQDILKSEFQTLFTTAEGSARNAVVYDTTNTTNWFALASLYQNVIPLGVTGAYDNAKAALDQASRFSPNNPNILFLEAELEVTNKTPDNAQSLIQTALSEKPNYTDAIFLLAQIEASEGDAATAIAQLQAAADASPRDASVYLELGLFKYNTGDYQGAVSALERSVTLDPTVLNTQYFLGLSYAKVGQTDNAKAIFASLQKAVPGNQDINTIVSNLNAGIDPLTGLASSAATSSVTDQTSTSTTPGTSPANTTSTKTSSGTKKPATK